MSVLDTLTAVDSMFEGFAAGGNSQIVLTMNSATTAAGRLEEKRLREHLSDIPNWLNQAAAFYVDPLMVPLVCSAGAVVPDASVVQVYDPPSPCGFLLIGGGATLCHLQDTGSDGNISAEAFTAFLWATLEGRVYVQRFERSPSRWLLLDVSAIPFGAPLPAAARAKDREYSRRLVIPGGKPDSDHNAVLLPLGPETRELMEAPESQTSDASLRWLVACWRLMGQMITEVAEDIPTRQQRRQLERKNVPLRQVSVIRLRRTGSRGDGGTTVNWSHRWVVRGHWRQQRCKDVDGQWTTRPVFIHPYIKGPETAPLLVRRHVNHLVR